MSCKSFNICVIFDILDVTCPGVWICPKGMVYLDVWLFGCNNSTSFVEPKFPLAFNETFSFHENFLEPVNLNDVQKCLEEKHVHIALVQVHKKKQVTLATYNSGVDQVLYPEHNRLSRNGEIALLMKNEPLFPTFAHYLNVKMTGTISPKITLVTKTSVTEQINTISCDDRRSSSFSKTQYRPNRMKRVHHSKSTNPHCFHKRENRTNNNDGSTNTDSDTDSQLYCQKSIKTDNIMDCKCYTKISCKHCEHMNKLNTTKHKKEFSNQNNINAASSESIHKALNDKYKHIDKTSNKFSKNMKGNFKAGVHYCDCCKTKLNNSSGTNESTKTSDEGSVYEEKSMGKSGREMCEESIDEPRKMNPKIKGQLHLGVYCKCGKPICTSNPSWRIICNEVNRRDAIGDEIKYNLSLRNYYRRLYDGATYQLSRNLKLL